MKLKTLFSLYLLWLHLGLAGLVYLTLDLGTREFILCEGFLLVSLICGVWLLYKLNLPLSFLHAAKDLLAEEPPGTQLVHQDVPELDQLMDVYNGLLRRLHEEQLRLGEQRGIYHELIESVPIGLLILDFEDRVSSLNPYAEQWLDSPTQVLGKPLAESDHALFQAIGQVPLHSSQVVVWRGFKRFFVRASTFYDRGFTRRFYLIEDRTREMQETERAAYEKLLRTMAHEINNSVGATNSLLQTVRSFGEVLEPSDREPFKEALDVVIHRNTRLSHFTRELVQVVKLPPLHPVEDEVGPLLQRIALLMSARAEEAGVQMLGPTFQGVCSKVLWDPDQMEQALLNIVKNAIEACEPGGSVTITCAENSDKVRIEVWDTGNKLGLTDASQLFKPFFTTKPEGQGIGLVLIRDILQAHGFDYALESLDGRTRFLIEMPRSVVSVQQSAIS
ncbi:MAG: hypothetical protein H6510_08940 [Acidobacteria bacterium]|nr:hypothetical protein [Acidobacteriota bacterium]MCB9397929.1 hypothetical protein [Acidobacteriota bacterium]